jgi:hypothetical protein
MSIFWNFFILISLLVWLLCHNGAVAWGLGEGPRIPHRNKTPCYENLHMASELLGSCEHDDKFSSSIKYGDFVTSWEIISFSVRTPLHGSVSQSVSQSIIQLEAGLLRTNVRCIQGNNLLLMSDRIWYFTWPFILQVLAPLFSICGSVVSVHQMSLPQIDDVSAFFWTVPIHGSQEQMVLYIHSRILFLCSTRSVTGRTIGWSGFYSQQGLWIFLFDTMLRPAPWPHPASYPMGTGRSFPRGKAAEEWSWQLTSI